MIFFVLTGLWGMIIIFLLRNQAVYNFQTRMLKSTREIARPEIALKCLDAIGAVSYNEMVWKFWKPLKSFYSEEILKLLD